MATNAISNHGQSYPIGQINFGGQTGEFRLIGPTEAKAIIARQPKRIRQRPLKRRHVQRLVSDLLDGYWCQTWEPIRLTTYGDIADGQHRLQMVIDSGVAVWFFVITGFPEEFFDKVDIGIVRSGGDIAGMGGFARGKAIAGAANTHYKIVSQTSPSSQTRRGAFGGGACVARASIRAVTLNGGHRHAMKWT